MAPLQNNAEADYVQTTEGKRDDLAARVRDSAFQLLARLIQTDRWISDNQAMHDAVYGVGAGAALELDAETTAISTAVDGLFTTGLMAQSRQEMDADIQKRLDSGGVPPPLP